VCARTSLEKEFLEALDPHQFGVAISGGTEILVHTARMLYEKALERPDFFLLKFDFRNAFNCISRQVFLDEVATVPIALPLCFAVLWRHQTCSLATWCS
jgi:hypothetical protein